MDIAPDWPGIAFLCRGVILMCRCPALDLIIEKGMCREVVPAPDTLRPSRGLERRECRDRSFPRRLEWSRDDPFRDSVVIEVPFAALSPFPGRRFLGGAAISAPSAELRSWNPPSAG